MSKVKLHFGQVTIRLFLFDMGESLEHQTLKHVLLPFKYLSRRSGIFRETFKNVLKKQHAIE
jgi:hypothetical protein